MAYYLDYSAAKLSGATVRAAGYTGVIRYIDAPAKLKTKHTNLAEYRDHLANGLDVHLVFQVTTNDSAGGYPAGVAFAQRAKEGTDYLGYTREVYFTNDQTVLPSAADWTAFLDGVASVFGRERTGAYGFRNAMLAAQGHASAFWQSGRYSELVPFANYWQDNNTQVTVGGITCDRNLVVKNYTLGSPAVTPTPEENEPVSLIETITVTPPNLDVNSVRVRTLPGTKGAAIIVRPLLDAADGRTATNPVWLGNVFAWGSDGVGVGGNPKNQAGFVDRCASDRKIALPDALWADVEYSSAAPFEIQVVG